MVKTMSSKTQTKTKRSSKSRNVSGVKAKSTKLATPKVAILAPPSVLEDVDVYPDVVLSKADAYFQENRTAIHTQEASLRAIEDDVENGRVIVRLFGNDYTFDSVNDAIEKQKLIDTMVKAVTDAVVKTIIETIATFK